MNWEFNTYTWTIWMITAASIPLLTYNPVYHTILLIILILSAVKHKIPISNTLAAGFFFGIPLLAINILLLHHGEHTLYTIPKQILLLKHSVPLYTLSGPVTIESIAAAVVFMLLLINMLLVFSIYNNVTTPDKILQLMPKSLSHSTLLVALVLRFIPTITADAQSIRDAQRCRGLKKEGALKNQLAFLVPTVVNSLERSYSLAEALESRGYSRERTCFYREQWHLKDKIVSFVFSLGVLYLLHLKVSSGLSYWDALSPIKFIPDVNYLVLFFIIFLLIP